MPLPNPYSFEGWLEWRRLARTDLLFLCNFVLGYKDVNWEVHGKMICNLQRFPGGVDKVDISSKQRALKPGQFLLPDPKTIINGYKPLVPLWDLEPPPTGERKFLNMIPRGHLKSSVITAGHAIQWVVNYPNARICLDSHTLDGVQGFLGVIRNHWTKNQMFRYLFPEHVPHGKEVERFGNLDFFDTKARTQWEPKEHTFNVTSLGGTTSGPHYECLFHDDLVDKKNIVTPGLIASVREHLAACEPLVDKNTNSKGEAVRGWEYLTGTFYDYSDVNYTVYEEEKKKLNAIEWADYERDPKGTEARLGTERVYQKRTWNLNVQSAAPNYPNGPTLWPRRYPIETLRKMEHDPAVGPALLAAQYLMNPIPPGTGLIDSKDEIVWTPRKVINELYPRLSLHCAVDLAGMDESARNISDNDFTAITVGGFGTDGHLYVVEAIHGKFKPERVIEELFSVMRRHPRIRQIKVEKEAHARVLMPFLYREENKRKEWLPILAVPRDNQQSKKLKIKGLGPWFKRGMIHFAEDLPCRIPLTQEIMRFPKYHDDLLDTIYDLFMDKDGRVTADVIASEKALPEKSAMIKNSDGTWTIIGDMATAAEEYIYGENQQEEFGVCDLTGM